MYVCMCVCVFKIHDIIVLFIRKDYAKGIRYILKIRVQEKSNNYSVDLHARK